MDSRNHSFLRAFLDRTLDSLPILTTLLLLSIYPALRYLRDDPFLAEMFRFAFISFWIGFLTISMIRAQKTRQKLLVSMETDWLEKLQALGHCLSHYAIFMPLKKETNRRVLFQTFLSISRQCYPLEKVTLMPIIEAEDEATLERIRELVPPFQDRLRVIVFTYPTAKIRSKCKATSVSTAARWLAAEIDQGRFGDDEVKVLIIDADTILHPQDLAFREHIHLQEQQRAAQLKARGIVLQSLTTYTANYWKVPMLPRIHNTGFVLYQMGKMQTKGDYLLLGPGTSLPFKDFRDVDYLEPNRHNEDMQFRYKVVMEGYRVAPLLIPTWGQAPLATWDSWRQIARWARGAVDLKFVVNYRRKLRPPRLPLVKTKTYQALRALLTNAMAPLMVLLPAQLILISWLSPCIDPVNAFKVFISPDVLALKGGSYPCIDAMAAFNLRFQTIVLTSSMLLGMVLVPSTLKPIIYQRLPKRWKRARRFFEWFRLTFTPLNLHHYFLMASAQLYIQTKLALGFPIHHTEVTRK